MNDQRPSTLRQPWKEREAQARAQQEREIELSRARDDARAVMKTPQGRQFVRRLLEASGLERPTFNTSALTMAHNEGRRQFGIELRALLIEASPEDYFDLLKEMNGVRQQ